LYKYTPYTPNAAALNNLYGLGDNCSAYGNRNFWRYFTDWFGSTQFGNLVRTAGGGVYFIDNSTKRAFPSELIFLSYAYKWADISTITPDLLALIPEGPVMAYNVHFREGRLVSTPNQGVFLVDTGLKRPLSSEAAFLSYSYKWSDVLTITPAELALIPDGAVMNYNAHYRDGKLVKTTSGIYLVDNGTKRAFPSDTVFLSYSYKWSDVLTITPAELALIPDGAVMALKTN
jgi:uncharacterized protein Veg